MACYKVLFLTLLITTDQCCYKAFRTELSVTPVVNSLVTNTSGRVLSEDAEVTFANTFIDVHLNRQRRSVDHIKKSFAIFAKRVWQGFRLYLQGKTKTPKRLGSEQLQKLLKLSMHHNEPAPVEFVPLIENIVLPHKSRILPLPKKYHVWAESNQAAANGTICRYFRQKWIYQLVSEDYDKTQPAIVNYVQSLSDNALNLYWTLDKRPNRWYLWQMKTGDTPASDFTTQFLNLYKLTLAYGTNGTAFYGNRTILTAVIDGIDLMVTKKGYDGEKYHGNWWHWLIGVPDLFTKILMIINDELNQKQKDLYFRVLNQYVANPFFAKRLNRNVNIGVYTSNLAEIMLALGVLQEDEETIRLAKDAVIEVLKPSIKGNIGFYPDGSFTHKDIPYTGLYGKEMIKSIAQILYITKDTDFELPSYVRQILVDLIDRAFLPLIYDGEMMASVCGRAISRAQPSSKIGYGSTLLYDLLIVSKSAPQQSQNILQEAVKFWMRKNLRFYLANTRNYNDITMMTQLLQDESIIGDELPFSGVKLFASMDRFVHRTPDYMMGLALYSSRISAFDAGGKENKRGWHTADGMIYLYNDDEVQFNAAYWPTVDPFRLPGTTIDTIHLFDEILNVKTTSSEKWVGGVANDNQAVVGMSLNKINSKNRGMFLAMDLRAKKSWFVVEGQIVALGAGITGNTKASIETIVDNRLLNDRLNYVLLSNEGVINNPADAAAAPFIENRKMRLKVLWILLQESSHKASIGYYFPAKETVDVICERRTGTYLDINEEFMSSHDFAGNYSKIIIRHGRKIGNVSYAYVMLPGITKQALKGYIENNPIIILANTEDIQAVRIKESNYVGINIWKETGGEVDGISSNKPASILKQSRKNEDTYVVSDPTQSSDSVQIKVPEFTKVVHMDNGVEYDGAYDVFIINFRNSSGANRKFTVAYLVYEQIHS